MIQSVIDYFSNQPEQQQNQQQLNPQQQQFQGTIINAQEQFISPRDGKFPLNQSHSIGQSQYINVNNSQQNVHVNTSHQNSIVAQQQQSQYISNNTLANQQPTQQIQNQSILSIKTQANREQQYVYCPTHTEFFITNICSQKECIEPLCPECIVGHNELHVYNQTQSQLQNIQSAREASMNQTEHIIKQLSQAKQQIVSQLQQTMNDVFKKNIETLNGLKQYILQLIESSFKELSNKLNDTYQQSKDMVEQLNAVIFQRIDNHQNILAELQSPFYIKALIETMENPTSFTIEESSYQYLVDNIKENNSLQFTKSATVDETLSEVFPKLFSYQKRQKIFQQPGQNLLESRRMSDSGDNIMKKDQIKGFQSPLSQRSNIFNQQTLKLQNSNGKDFSSPISKQQIIPSTTRQSIGVSPPQREQFSTTVKQNQNSQSLTNLKIIQKNENSQQKATVQQTNNPFNRSKTISLGNENYHSQQPRTEQQNNWKQQINAQQIQKINSSNKNFETFNDFNERNEDLEEIGQSFKNKIQNQERGNDQLKSENQFQYNHNFRNEIGMSHQKPTITSLNDKQADKLDLPLSKQKIQEEFRGANKNDFIDSFTEEEINGGTREEFFLNCQIANQEEEDLPTEKHIYVFVEGTKIFHSIKFEEYLSFPKSAIKTDFLEIDFRIPICHNSISVPNQDLVLITGGIMYEKDKRKSIRNVYKLNKEKNSLEQISGMLNARSQHGLVYNEGRVYAIGGCSGYDESSSINKCEYYDITTLKWVEIADCLYKASGAGLTVFNKKFIYKFGGKDDIVKPVNFIECYDIKKNKWQQVQFNLNLGVNNSLTYFPFVKQLNSNQILLLGGYQHSVKMDASYIITVNHSENSKYPPGLQFEKSCTLPSQFEFQYSQSYVYHNEIYILKNANKISTDDQNIFLVYNGYNWNLV